MKFKLLLAVLLTMGLGIQANASVSVEQSLSPEYLHNNGYSGQMEEMINVSRARAVGKEYYTEGEIKANNLKQPLKFLRKLYVYFDPAAEDYSFYHHDNKTTPSYTDL